MAAFYSEEKDLLTTEEWNLIRQSLLYTRKKFEEYESYPSEDYRQTRIAPVNDLIAKIDEMLKA